MAFWLVLHLHLHYDNSILSAVALSTIFHLGEARPFILAPVSTCVITAWIQRHTRRIYEVRIQVIRQGGIRSVRQCNRLEELGARPASDN